MSNEVDDFLAHYGIQGMRWGVRKNKTSSYRRYQDKVFNASPGASKTKVIAKNGDQLSIEKERPGPLSLAVSKLTGQKPENALSSMVIRDKSGEKVGSFQVWREPGGVVRGEWLEVKASSQGRGYSKAAIEGLLISARKDPMISTVKLQVPSEAEAAKHIYSSLGFAKERSLGSDAIFGELEDWSARV